MKKYIILASIATAFIFGLSSCSDFLDELPDNRTELTPDNVSKILLAAYPTTAICEMAEMASDNTDAYPTFLHSTACRKIFISGKILPNGKMTLQVHCGSRVTLR